MSQNWRLNVYYRDFDIWSFESQSVQYPETGPAGISYFAGVTDIGTVDCLLYRASNGELIGILNHYPFDSQLENTGNVFMVVAPSMRKQGIGLALVFEALDRWPELRTRQRIEQQRYSESGAALVLSLVRKGVL